MLTLVAAGRSGRQDVAESNEDLLFEDLAPHGDVAPPAKRRAAPAAKPRAPRQASRSRR